MLSVELETRLTEDDRAWLDRNTPNETFDDARLK